LKKAAQKLLLCWAEGLKVPAVRSTVGIAPEGMGVGADNALRSLAGAASLG